MTEELKQQLTDSLQTELVALSEAAKKFNVRRQYLVNLAVKGKLKAFKVGEEWYAEPKRLAEFLSGLHQHLDKELENHLPTRPSVWVQTRRVKPVSKKSFFWRHLAGEAALATVTAAVGVGLIISFMPRNSYLLVYCSKYFLNYTFIPAAQAVYQAPVDLVGQTILAKIDDEIITRKIEWLIKYNLMKRRGRVAGGTDRAGF
ncbi:MAG: hypothetical protein WC668_03455 [Patescibacteria group bacterium]|jgi:hypothetical protein